MAMQKIERISVVDQICDSIKSDIADGVLKPGEKLQPESELAELFGVNRFTVRLALQKLSALGLIHTKVGDGSFVNAPSIKQYVREMSLFFDHDITLEDIRRLRALLEKDSILLATENATEEEKRQFEICFERYNALIAKIQAGALDDVTMEEFNQADIDFHMQIIRMSHNALYMEVYTMVRELIKRHIHQRTEGIRKNAAEGKVRPEELHRLAYNAIIHADKDSAELYGVHMCS